MVHANFLTKFSCAKKSLFYLFTNANFDFSNPVLLSKIIYLLTTKTIR